MREEGKGFYLSTSRKSADFGGYGLASDGPRRSQGTVSRQSASMVSDVAKQRAIDAATLRRGPGGGPAAIPVRYSDPACHPPLLEAASSRVRNPGGIRTLLEPGFRQ